MTFSLAYEHAQDDGYAAYTPYNQRGKIQTAGSSLSRISHHRTTGGSIKLFCLFD
jgi:hypothetical protein